MNWLDQVRKKLYPLSILIKDFNKFQIIYKVKSQHLSYKSFEQLSELFDIIRDFELNMVDGEFLEAGCALGGSAIVITAAKSMGRRFTLYDTFEMIPPPSNQDGQDVHERYEAIISGQAIGINGDVYYGYRENLLDTVKASFVKLQLPVDSNNVQLKRGLFEDTLNINTSIAMAHLDCDWYESVMICLERIVPCLVVGGVLIIDDYHDWSGCKKAIDKYFEGKQDKFIFENRSQLLIWRTDD